MCLRTIPWRQGCSRLWAEWRRKEGTMERGVKTACSQVLAAHKVKQMPACEGEPGTMIGRITCRELQSPPRLASRPDEPEAYPALPCKLGPGAGQARKRGTTRAPENSHLPPQHEQRKGALGPGGHSSGTSKSPLPVGMRGHNQASCGEWQKRHTVRFLILVLC